MVVPVIRGTAAVVLRLRVLLLPVLLLLQPGELRPLLGISSLLCRAQVAAGAAHPLQQLLARRQQSGVDLMGITAVVVLCTVVLVRVLLLPLVALLRPGGLQTRLAPRCLLLLVPLVLLHGPPLPRVLLAAHRPTGRKCPKEDQAQSCLLQRLPLLLLFVRLSLLLCRVV